MPYLLLTAVDHAGVFKEEKEISEANYFNEVLAAGGTDNFNNQ